jgi:DNA polymerase-3 subunit gamma/tau
MSDFVVSARKYRPATFDTVVGQHSITSTLKNAIKSKHLAQAFLFCGPRGVGKTTCARILAKTINCFNITSNIEACNECESCKSFNEGHSLNIYELDAASNNSVEDIRNLISQVSFAPQLGTHKVYIIDEVHMLSQAAFNAFLKTLEEPPRHAIFILATTEKHKIIPTILSRCQIFDFNRIQIEDIANHLAYIAKSEGVKAEPDALHIIAQKADGALRDACSIFDQIVSFAGNNVTYKAVIDNLNILDYDYYFKVTDGILDGNIPSVLMTFNEILNNGFDGHNFINGLAGHFRNILVCKDAVTLQLLEVGANIRDKYKEQSARCPQSFLLRALGLCSKADVSYKISKNPRLLIELTLMQLCSLQSASLETDEKKNELISIKLPGDKKTVQDSSSPIVVAEPKQNYSKQNSSPEKTGEKKELVTSGSITSTQQTVQKSVKKTIPVGGLSINGLLNKNKQGTQKETGEEKEPRPRTDLPKKDFTEQQLLETWMKYAKQAKEKSKVNLYATLTSRQPVLKQDFLVEFTIDNLAQRDAIANEKAELMLFLRSELQNYDIQLETIVTKDDSEKKPYTASDKFKRMAEKNPVLNNLKQKFDLDLGI